MSESPSLIMFPGVGADHRLFQPQKRAFPQLEVPAWVPPRDHETLPEYAARLAGTLRISRPLVLGGVSFGGMLAYEMARRLRPEAVVLIASCRTREGISPLLRRFRPVVARLPLEVGDAAKLIAPLAVATFRLLSPTQRQLCLEMFQQADSRFMRWVITAILGWEPCALEGVPVCQIHGRHDPVIPAARIEADEIVADGGHLINLSHAEQVNAFIRKAMERLP